MTLSYDPPGRLQQTTAGSAVTRYLYAGTDLVAELDGSGNVLRRYVHGPGTDDPVVWYEGAGMTTRNYLHADERGSVIATTNSAGAATLYAYGPYGEQSGWSGSRFSYTGQTSIPEAHLYYYKARVYSPSLGRFLQTDPIGTQDDLNLYTYVGNDPLDRSDPTGTTDCSLGADRCTAEMHDDPKQEGTAKTPTQLSTMVVTAHTVTAPVPSPNVIPEIVVVRTRAAAAATAIATVTLAGIINLGLVSPTASNDTTMSAKDKNSDKSKPKAGSGKRAYATDKKFRRWFHREYKPDTKATSKGNNNPDVGLDEGYEQWLGEGKPGAD